jgi:hypothetical protein
VRPNLDSLAHKLAAVATTVVEDVVDLVADLAAAWVLVVVVVKSTSPTFVASVSFVSVLWSAELTLTFSSRTL